MIFAIGATTNHSITSLTKSLYKRAWLLVLCIVSLLCTVAHTSLHAMTPERKAWHNFHTAYKERKGCTKHCAQVAAMMRDELCEGSCTPRLLSEKWASMQELSRQNVECHQACNQLNPAVWPLLTLAAFQSYYQSTSKPEMLKLIKRHLALRATRAQCKQEIRQNDRYLMAQSLADWQILFWDGGALLEKQR